MVESITRRDFLKKGLKAAALGIAASTGAYYGANAAMSFRKKQPGLDRIDATRLKGKFPEGIESITRVSINGKIVFLVGCQHGEERSKEHLEFLKSFIRKNNVDVVGMESGSLVSGAEIFRQEGYFSSIAKGLKTEVDVADVEGRRVSPQTIISNMLRDLVTNLLSISYPLHALLNGVVKNAKTIAIVPAAILSLLRGGLPNTSDSPINLLPEIGFDYTSKGLRKDGKNAEEYWLRYPDALFHADAFFAKSIRKLAEKYNTGLVLVGAFHVPGTMKCLAEGIEPKFKTTQDSFVVYRKDGAKETVQL